MDVTPRPNTMTNLLDNFLPSPKSLQQHLKHCKICNLPNDIRWEIDEMISNGIYFKDLKAYMRKYDVFLTESQVETHKKYFKFVCNEAKLKELLDKLTEDEKAEAIREGDPIALLNYKQIQEAKDRELLYIWNTTLPILRELMDASIGQNMLPVDDYASAYECILKTALLLEGKPTGRIAVEGGNVDGVKSSLDKLCEMVGVQYDPSR